MLIAREPGSENKIQFRLRLNEFIYKEIDDYCEWADIRSRDYFIEKACQYIFQNDKEWLHYKKEQKKSSK